MKSPTELQAENFRLRALLVEVRTALIVAGWNDDKLMQRLREEIAPAAPDSDCKRNGGE